jgi:2,3-bisphosphoglycerate-dependent phosphoglycerate mutase
VARLIAAIIRHGDYHQLTDTPSAHQPFPLTEKGKAQALEAAQGIRQTLQQEGWTLSPELHCSSLLRAWQTADILRGELKDACASSPQLTETMALAERGLGIAGNLSISQIEALLREDGRVQQPPPDWKSNSHYCLPLPGAESLMQAGRRVADYLSASMEQLATRATGNTLQLFVGHGAAFRHGAHLLGILEFGQIAQLSMYHAAPVYLEYLGQGGWRHIAGDWKVRSRGEDYKD